MEEETVSIKGVTVIPTVPASTQEVSDEKKGDEETSLNMELGPSCVTERSCADASTNDEQRSSRKKKKKMAAQEKMRALELDNAQLKEKLEQMTEVEEKLNALQAELKNVLSEHKELSGIKEAYESLHVDLERSKKNTTDHSMREEELERLLEAAKDEMSSLQEELQGLHERMMEKEKLEESLMSATLEVSAMEVRANEMNRELELLRTSEALLLSTKNELQVKVSESEAAAADALIRNSELEHKLESLQGLFEAANAVTDETRLNLEAALSRMEDSDTRVSELELLLETQKSRISDLEQVVETKEEKFRNAETELLKHSEMVSTLTAEKELAKQEFDKAEAVASQKSLELEDLVRSSCSKVEDSEKRASELQSLLETEKELMNLQLQELRVKILDMESALSKSKEAKFELEGQLKELSDIRERNQELEEFARSSEDKIEDSDRRVKELEVLLETQKSRVNDLEQVVETTEGKSRYAETELMKHSEMVSTLTAEKEMKMLELESAAAELALTKQEFDKVDALAADSVARNSELEQKLNASNERNLELEDVIRSSYFKIEESERRTSELEFLLETQKSRTKDLEQDIDSLVQNFEQAEGKSKEYGEMVSALKFELDKSCVATSRLENALDAAAEDERRLIEEKGRSEEALHDSLGKLQEAENLIGLLHSELIATQGRLESVQVEMSEKLRILEDQVKDYEDTNSKLANTASELMSQYDRLTVLQSESEARFLQAQAELNETVQKLSRKELDEKELSDKCSNLEDQLKILEVEIHEVQGKLSEALSDKEFAVESFESSLKATEDLRQELSSDRQSFQNTIASITEEKRLLGEANTVAVNEMQALIAELDRQLKEYKESNGSLNAELENLKLQAADYSVLQTRVSDLQEQLQVTEAQFKKEICSIMEEKQLDNEANREAQIELQAMIGQLHAELESAKLQAVQCYASETRVKELQELLLETESQLQKQIQNVEAVAAAREVELTSKLDQLNEKGDIGLDIVSVKERKKKKLVGPIGEASFPMKNIKIAVGVGLVSIIAGILAGKK